MGLAVEVREAEERGGVGEYEIRRVTNLRMWSTRFIITITILFAAITVFSQVSDSTKVSFTPDSLLNKLVPKFSGKSIKGTSIDSDNLQGRVTLINFFFIGCLPCMYEINYLNEIDSTYSDKSFQVISIASNSVLDLLPFVDTTKEGEGAFQRKWNKINDIRYEIIAACKNSGIVRKDKHHTIVGRGCNDIAKDFFVSGMPTTFIIDRNRIIRYVSDGFGMEEELCRKITNEYKAMIEKLLLE